jgi:hypothetical protein
MPQKPAANVSPLPPPRDDLAAWLTRAARDADVLGLELEAGDGDDVRAIYAASWAPARDPAATMAAELRAAASAHGELQAGPVVYRLRAGRAGHPLDQVTTVRVSGPHASGPLATGAPADLVATAQRHAETAHMLSMRTLAAASDAIRSLANEVRERAASDQEEIRYWRQRSRELRDAHDEATRVRAEVELGAATELERERRISRVLEQGAAVVLPALSRRLATPSGSGLANGGNGQAPNQAAPEAAALSTVRGAWAHLSPETIDKIAGDLPPEVALAVVAALSEPEPSRS